MVWGPICVFFCSSSRPESPLLCHLLKYMGGSSRAKKSLVAKKIRVSTIPISVWDGLARKYNFYRPSSLTQILPGAKSVKKMYIVTPIMGHFWLQIVWVDEMSFFYGGVYKSEFLFIAHGLRGNQLFC